MERVRVGDRELRKVFAATLHALMRENRDVVYLEADLAGAIGTASLFQTDPDQAFDVGIMEANMVGVAAGMSLKGKIPFVHSFGTFASRRCTDQAFLSGCYNRANVKIIGSDPGIAAEANGGTHMPLEDVAIYRAFPEMTVLDIAEPHLLEAMLRQSVERVGMEYIRFPRKGKKCYYSPEQTFTIGKGEVLRPGTDVTLVASGLEVYESLEAAETLAAEGINAEVIDMFTIKPLDKELLLRSAIRTRCVVTAENHNIIGGLGSAVAEALIEELPIPMFRIGARDHFGEVGSEAFLREKFRMSAADIVQAARAVIARKR